MSRILFVFVAFLAAPVLAIEKFEVSGGLTGGFYADALGYGGHLGFGAGLDSRWTVGIETGLSSFQQTKARSSLRANVEVSSRVIPILLTGRYRLNDTENAETNYYAGLSVGLALLKENSKLTISGVPTVDDSTSSAQIMALGKIGMESPLHPELKLTGYAELEAGVVRDIFAALVHAGLRMGF